MPALDSMVGSSVTHMADQNKAIPVKTLCGQALDKETTRYFADKANLGRATCKVCRGIYFEERWSDPVPQQDQQDQQEEVRETQPEPPPPSSEPRRLFQHLSPPVNAHGGQKDLLDSNTVTVRESQDGS